MGWHPIADEPAETKGTTMTITVTIGRNVGSTPMRARDWQSFEQEIRDALTTWSTHDRLEAHTGEGTWTDEATGETVRETSLKITAVDVTWARVDMLTSDLAEIARAYRQDAVALTTGHTALVSAKAESARVATVAP